MKISDAWRAPRWPAPLMKPEYGLAPVGRDTPGVHALIDGPYRTGVRADGDFWVGTKHLREQIR